MLVMPASVVLGRQQPALGELAGAVEGNRAHHLRLREVAWFRHAAPTDARVRLFPDPADLVGDLGQAVSVVAVESAGEVSESGGRGEHFAVDIQLRLAGGAVADAGGARAAVASERQRFLLRFGTAVEAVEDL